MVQHSWFLIWQHCITMCVQWARHLYFDLVINQSPVVLHASGKHGDLLTGRVHRRSLIKPVKVEPLRERKRSSLEMQILCKREFPETVWQRRVEGVIILQFWYCERYWKAVFGKTCMYVYVQCYSRIRRTRPWNRDKMDDIVAVFRIVPTPVTTDK